MFKTIGYSALLAMTEAIKLEAGLETLYGLNDFSAYKSTTGEHTTIQNSAGSDKWTDTIFPPAASSLGGVTGDSAAGSNGSSSASVSWKRLSEIYPADKLKLFANREVYSTAQQGQLGDCYFIASMIAFDSRPGALEDLFVDTNISPKGAYTIKFNVGGKDAYVTVDDYVPVIDKSVKDENGQWHSGLHPVYADSRIYGEIWPMIMEKAWAKLIGTYANIEGGNNWWVMTHLTNDPTERIIIRGQGYTGTNASGVALWSKLKAFSDKEYLMFVGSDSQTYVTGHAWAILEFREVTIEGTPTKLVMMRNPWKGKAAWNGAYSEGTSEWTKLNAAVEGGVKLEDGKFWISYADFIVQFSRIYIGYSHESRTSGGAEKVEYRPSVDLSGSVK